MSEHNYERENIILKARVRQLQKALMQDDRHLQHVFTLPPRLADFLGLLVAKEFVSRDLLQYEMNIVADAQVAVWRLRKLLTPQGIIVRTRRGLGWYLDDDTKKRVAEMMARQPIGAVNGEEKGQEQDSGSQVSYPGEAEGEGEGDDSFDDGYYDDAGGADAGGGSGAGEGEGEVPEGQGSGAGDGEESEEADAVG